MEARHALREAEERRDRGIEPLPGERVGTASGASRLRPEYIERQEKLVQDVAFAQWRLDQALKRWNALR